LPARSSVFGGAGSYRERKFGAVKLSARPRAPVGPPSATRRPTDRAVRPGGPPEQRERRTTEYRGPCAGQESVRRVPPAMVIPPAVTGRPRHRAQAFDLRWRGSESRSRRGPRRRALSITRLSSSVGAHYRSPTAHVDDVVVDLPPSASSMPSLRARPGRSLSGSSLVPGISSWLNPQGPLALEREAVLRFPRLGCSIRGAKEPLCRLCMSILG